MPSWKVEARKLLYKDYSKLNAEEKLDLQTRFTDVLLNPVHRTGKSRFSRMLELWKAIHAHADERRLKGQ